MRQGSERANRESAGKKLMAVIACVVGLVSGVLGIVQYFSTEDNNSFQVHRSLDEMHSEVRNLRDTQREILDVNARLQQLLERYDRLQQVAHSEVEQPLATASQELSDARLAAQRGASPNMATVHSQIRVVESIQTRIDRIQTERRQLAAMLYGLQTSSIGSAADTYLISTLRERDRQLVDQLNALEQQRIAFQSAKEEFQKYISENIRSTFSNKYMN